MAFSSSFTLLASFVAEVKGVMFYDLRRSRACRGERVVLRRQPNNTFNVNCVEVCQILRGRLLVGHLESAVAAHMSPLMCDPHVDIEG